MVLEQEQQTLEAHPARLRLKNDQGKSNLGADNIRRHSSSRADVRVGMQKWRLY